MSIGETLVYRLVPILQIMKNEKESTDVPRVVSRLFHIASLETQSEKRRRSKKAEKNSAFFVLVCEGYKTCQATLLYLSLSVRSNFKSARSK